MFSKNLIVFAKYIIFLPEYLHVHAYVCVCVGVGISTHDGIASFFPFTGSASEVECSITVQERKSWL